MGAFQATVDVHKLYYSFVTVYSCLSVSFQEIGQKWAKVAARFYVNLNLGLHSNFDIVCFTCLFTFNTSKD